MRLLPPLLCLLLLGTSGCLWKKKEPKSGSHIYGGNAPTIVFSDEQERAGGHVRTY